MPVLNINTLFLIDGLGAFITAFCLLFVLRPFEEYFGMPTDILAILSIIALSFAAYSFACFIFYSKISSKFIAPIIIANSAYCFSTIVLLIYYYHSLTFLGVAYFTIEVIILSGLIFTELKAFKAGKQNNF